MMQELDPGELFQSVQSALERMCFVFAELLEDDSPEGLDKHVALQLEAEGEVAKIFLSSDDDFLIELASSILGSEPDEVDPETDGIEALKEIINVCGGELNRLLGGEDRRIATGLPMAIVEVPDIADMEATFDSMGSCFRIRVLRLQTD